MRMHRNTRSKLIYGLILAMTVALGLGGLFVSQTLASKLADASLVTAPALGEAALIERQVGTVQVRLDGVVAAAARHEMQNVADQVKYLTTRQDLMTASLDRIQQGRHSDEVKAQAAKVRNATAEWWRRAATVEDLASAQNPAAAQALAVTHQVNDQAQQASSELSSLIKKELGELATSGQLAYAWQRAWMLLLLAGTIFIAVQRMIAAERVTRKLQTISDECLEGGNDLATAAAQVSTSAQSLAQTASEQAASLEETSATMEELSSMTNQNADHAQQVATLMRAADQKAVESNQAMSAASLSMTSIEESSQKVSRILKTIDEITFQTNILALNAAVEAARAGEAGLGFAAVAEEVRNLAQRSATASKETAALVEESLTKARDGRQRVEHLSASLGDITTHVRQVRELADDVCAASRQQAQGIGQVSEAIAQMEQVTQTLATTSEENAAASQEMTAQSSVTLRVASLIHSLVHGENSIRADAEAPAKTSFARPTARNIVKLGQPSSLKNRIAVDADLANTGTYRRF
jgi:methyl-accepting chemotaxis protein/methyl-accepting chemotaxis protein-1 (serine sensor receptor)